MVEVKEKNSMTSNIKVDKTLDEKSKGKVLFPEKHKKAMEHFKDRNLHQEIKEIIERERIAKP
jgi:hypothetical protein